MSEDGEHDHRRGAEVLRALNALLRHDGRRGAEDDPVAALRGAIRAGGPGGAMTVQYQAGSFFVDSLLVRLDAWTSAPAQELAERLNTLGVQAIRLDAAVSAANLRAFAEAWTSALREATTLPSNVEGIRIARRPPAPEGAAGRALVHYGALVRELEALGELEAGADVLPLRRALQVISEALPPNGRYQLLATAGAQEATAAYTAAALAIDAMEFGAWTGLEIREVFELGLSAALAALTPEGDPNRCARLLMSLTGLGANAEAAVVSVRDARSARRGRPSAAAGRLIALLERYSERVAGGEAPGDTLTALRSGVDPEVDAGLAALFARWKGPWPLGTPVQLADGALAVVVGSPSGPPEVVTLDREGAARAQRTLERGEVSALRSVSPGRVRGRLRIFFRTAPVGEAAADLAASFDWAEEEEPMSKPEKRRFVADDAWMAQPALTADYDELERFEPPTEEEPAGD